MAILTWDDGTKKQYEMGLSNGVLYVRNNAGAYPLGVAWNGLISVSDAPSGAEPTHLYANNTKYATLLSVEELGGSIEAYTYPDEWNPCDGIVEAATGLQISQQSRSKFGLAYRTEVGTEAGGDRVSYKLHVVYGCLASPSEKSYNTINDTPEAQTFNWDFTSSPEAVAGHQPTAKIVLDSAALSAAALAAVEEALFGAAAADPYLPLPAELLTMAALS